MSDRKEILDEAIARLNAIVKLRKIPSNIGSPAYVMGKYAGVKLAAALLQQMKGE